MSATREYSLHPLDRTHSYRQLPRDQVNSSYGQRNLELRAADYYASIRKPESEWKSIDDLAPQLAEFEHRVRAGDYDSAYQVLDSIESGYLFLWGYVTRLLAMRRKLSGRLSNVRWEAANLGRLGFGHHCLKNYGQAIRFHKEALEIARHAGDRHREGTSLGNLGITYGALRQVHTAIGFCKEALDIACELGDRRQESILLGSLGSSYFYLGRIEQGMALHRQALTIARVLSDQVWENIWLGFLGGAYLELGQVESAVECLEQALAITRQIGDLRHQVVWLTNLGNVYWMVGQSEDAIDRYEEALRVARRIGYRVGISYQLLGLGRASLSVGSYADARQLCTEALAMDVPRTSGQAAFSLGIVLLCQENPGAGGVFADATTRCHTILEDSPDLYEPRYVLAGAMVGQAVCDPYWMKEKRRVELLAQALAEYRRALDHCSAKGVVQDAILDLELIRAAGIEGLEPVFELLESAIE